jgi:hypothetical protein
MPPSKRSKHRRMGSNSSTEEKSDYESKVKIPSELVKGPWKKQEDELLVQLVEEHGPKDWSKIASKMALIGHVRMGKQCRERWFNHLSPDVRKEAWTAEEDRVIIESHRQLGNKWTAISRMLNGRPANAIKNHWNSTLKRQVTFGEIGSGSPRPNKRQRASTGGHQSRKKRRLDISSFEDSDEDFESSEDMDDEEESSDQITAEERSRIEEDLAIKDADRMVSVAQTQTSESQSDEEEHMNSHPSAAADPLAMDTQPWQYDIMYDASTVHHHHHHNPAQGFQFQYNAHTSQHNYNMYHNTYPAMQEFSDMAEPRQASHFPNYYYDDPFELVGSTYSP